MPGSPALGHLGLGALEPETLWMGSSQSKERCKITAFVHAWRGGRWTDTSLRALLIILYTEPLLTDTGGEGEQERLHRGAGYSWEGVGAEPSEKVGNSEV